MSRYEILITVLLLALATALTRFAPFLLFDRLKKPPEFIDYLGRVLPGAMMGLLVVYCFRGVNYTDGRELLPAIIATAGVVGIHLYKHNTVLSIALGTAVYMVLLRVM